MDVKPSKGLKVKVNAVREAVFGEDGVEVKKAAIPTGKKAAGTMTGGRWSASPRLRWMLSTGASTGILSNSSRPRKGRR